MRHFLKIFLLLPIMFISGCNLDMVTFQKYDFALLGPKVEVGYDQFYLLHTEDELNYRQVYDRIQSELSDGKEIDGCYRFSEFGKYESFYREMCQEIFEVHKTKISNKTYNVVEAHLTYNRKKGKEYLLQHSIKRAKDEKPYYQLGVGKLSYLKGMVKITVFKSCEDKNYSRSYCKNYDFLLNDASKAFGHPLGDTKFYTRLKAISVIPRLFKYGEVLKHVYMVKYPLVPPRPIPSRPDPKPLVFTSLDKLAGLVKSVQKKADNTAANLKRRVENAERKINQKIDDTGDRIGKQADKISPF